MFKYLALGAAALGFASSAQAITLFAFDDNSTLVSFDSANAGTYLTQVQVTGIQGDLLGIDFRPINGQLFGYTSTNRLYTINVTTGAATAVGGQNIVPGSSFGFDFNGTIDRIRLVSDLGNNNVLDPNTGAITAATAVFYPAGDPNSGANPRITANAYTIANPPGTSPGAPGGPTQLYGIDSGLNILVTQANSAGTLGTVGALGFDVGARTGFDIGSDNVAYLLNISSLYQVNLTTGAATLIGTTPTALFGLSAAPAGAVPEPASWAMMLVGFGAIGYSLRSRRAGHRIAQAV